MKILLLTPPLTQLNTPYPATPYLKGFLEKEGHEVMQADLGIELVNRLFSYSGLEAVFGEPERKVPPRFRQMVVQKQQYLDTVDAVMRFLQGTEPSLATRICNTDWLPRGARFRNMADVHWAFGTLGNTEMARYIATLYIQDIADFIKGTRCRHFELIRYAEHLCLHLPELDPLLQELEKPITLPDTVLLELLDEKMRSFQPDVVGISIPFPGNLMGAFHCSRFVRKHFPLTKVVWGGGYVNTELRQLRDKRVFEFAHFVCLDDGEPAWRALLRYLKDENETHLCQTFFLDHANELRFIPARPEHHIPFRQVPAPDYSDLPLHKYISLIDVANPMHKLWSDGRWNKITLAHGCYWAKCAFCDTSLPYISCYEPLSAGQICDYMEEVMAQTSCSGFHFTDEAAPPALLRQLSEEIIRRKMVVSWWTNIRFEKAFTAGLCNLMARAGCIAVSGGVEVASDRLLKLITKGVSVDQAFDTARHLSQSGVMVHAYLMYGFPTQTQQETLQGLEVVRQMFEQGVLQSAFWHRYAMTLHSPSGKQPGMFGARHLPHTAGTFANNEIPFTDGQQISLDLLGEALRVATYNYMHGIGFDWPVKKWLKAAAK